MPVLAWYSTALILSPNHNLPPGYVFDITQATMDSFLARLGVWSGQPACDWVWFRDGHTKAWFAAAARRPHTFAVPMFPLAVLAPTLDSWRVENIDAGVSSRLRHFVSTADQLRHRYLRDHLFLNALPSMVAKFQIYEERSLTTVQVTPGLRCIARDPALLPYIYHYCRPILPAWSKTHGFDLHDLDFAPPPGEQIFNPATIDHRSKEAATALVRPEDTSAERTPDDCPPSPKDPSMSAMMRAMLAAGQTASPPIKRKRDQPATPPSVSFNISGTSIDNPRYDDKGP